MYRKCILKIPPCYDIKYSDQSWNVITGTKPCCKKCVAIFCHQTIPIIHAPTSATPYTLPTTGNQKPLTILVTCFIYKLLVPCSMSTWYIIIPWCYINFFVMFSVNYPCSFFVPILYIINSCCFVKPAYVSKNSLDARCLVNLQHAESRSHFIVCIT